MDFLLQTLQAVTYKHVVMWVIGLVLIYLAIKKEMEPALLLPIGFGVILVNIPFSNVIDSEEGAGIIQWGSRRRKRCPFCCLSASAP